MVFVLHRWGRGHPEEYTNAINLGEEGRYDSETGQKPRSGQILWIRGLTRLQTQVRASLAASLAAAKIGRIIVNFFRLLFKSSSLVVIVHFYLNCFYIDISYLFSVFDTYIITNVFLSYIHILYCTIVHSYIWQILSFRFSLFLLYCCSFF